MAKGAAPFDQGLFLVHLHKGKEYFDQDQLEKAREELEAAYQLRPDDEKVLNMLGMTYYKLEMLSEAEAMYVRLASTNPEVYALQSNLGLIQLKLNKLQEARDALNRALDLQPSNSKAHFYMGLLYEKEELWEEALYHFQQANAEKMVAKMRMKMEEQQVQSEILSPYEVVEVLGPEDPGFTEADFASVMNDEISPETEPESASENTGRMRSHDLAEAMFQVHHSDEIVRPEEILESPEEETMESQDTASIRIQPVAMQPSTEEEEEPVENPVSQPVDDDMIIEEPPWTKAESDFFSEPFGKPEPVIHSESNVVIPSTIDEPFFLSDDIAADISTFLAQSRPEHNAEEDVFYQDSTPSELAILRTSQLEETQEHDVPEEHEYRIPTPEEVENEVTLTDIEQNPEQHLPIDEQLITERADFVISTPLESVEELTEEIRNEIAQPEPVPEEEEDLEVNFAVTEGEEEDALAEEGFLQPSPLTPDQPEEKLEETQDMEFATRGSLQIIEETPLLIQDSVEFVPEPAAEEVQPPQEQSPAVEEVEPRQQQSPEAEEVEPPQQQPMVEESAPPPASASESAANLDQFSRDRLYVQPLIGSDRFLLIDPHLLEIIISDSLICRIGTISSYTGNLQFTPREEQQEKARFIVVGGTGILFLADRRKEIFLVSLNNEVLYVESNHLLVAQSSLKVEPQSFQQKGAGATFSLVKISGRGTLALTCQTKPLTLNVHEGLPANIPAQAVIAWSGKLISEVMNDDELRKIMSSRDETMLLRFRGAGDVVVEQGGLWGDRRTRR